MCVDIFGTNDLRLFAATTSLKGSAESVVFGTAETKDVGISPTDNALVACTTQSVVLDATEAVWPSTAGETGVLFGLGLDLEFTDAEFNNDVFPVDRLSLPAASFFTITPKSIPNFADTYHTYT